MGQAGIYLLLIIFRNIFNKICNLFNGVFLLINKI